ncbi:MAG: hypothetical protein LBD09_07395, partial [Treponema sp.]|nr:hypothetical protein [Treponema sp.]
MRLVTRADFDGLACSILLDRLGLIDFWEFVHPTEVQQGRVKVTGNDVIANLPYVPGCRMWFDHHTSETERLGHEFFEEYEAVMGRREEAAAVPTLGVVEHSGGLIKEYETVKVSYAAPSCARVVYDFYTRHGYRFDQFVEMVRCVDKVDSANLTGEELADPRGWILLGLVMDPRTGLEKFKKYSVGLKELTVRLSAACQDHGIEEVLALPELK